MHLFWNFFLNNFVYATSFFSLHFFSWFKKNNFLLQKINVFFLKITLFFLCITIFLQSFLCILFFRLCFPLDISMISSLKLISSILQLISSKIEYMIWCVHHMSSNLQDISSILQLISSKIQYLFWCDLHICSRLRHWTHEYITSSHDFKISLHDFKNTSNIIP